MTYMTIEETCLPIQLLLSDVDGVFTDGGILYDNNGIEVKQFHVRDGMAVKLWQKAGYEFGLITSRSSHIVKVRAAELGIQIIRQGFAEKMPAAKQIIEDMNLKPEQVCYIGDDLPDLALIEYVGLGVAVADAAEDVRDRADFVTKAKGGSGAVRELVEMILKFQHRWEDVIQKYRLNS